ncbi:MAG: hypothetical protein ACFWUJ_11600 [Pseudomonas fragi]|jgi:hypothetical protein
MQLDFIKLRQALLDPADGPYALAKMRELLIHSLEKKWPSEAYRAADLLLPWSGNITALSRDHIAWFVRQCEEDQGFGQNGISNAIGIMQLICS